MKHILVIIILLSLICLSTQKNIEIPSNNFHIFHLEKITHFNFNIRSKDDSYFTLLLLPSSFDDHPELFYDDNLINNCSYVKQCSGSLDNLSGNYTLFIINRNLNGAVFAVEYYDEPDYGAGIFSLIFYISLGILSCC